MRINFFGGPGSGKSTTTAWIFAMLKDRKVSVEHVSEYVKAWAYQKRNIQKHDQLYLFAKQQQYEYRYLSQGVLNIVTDSPCFLSVIYSAKYISEEYADAIMALCRLYDRDNPSLNIFLSRGEKPYITEGRYQTLEQAKELDAAILAGLQKHYPENFHVVDYKNREKILELVLSHVEGDYERRPFEPLKHEQTK